MIHAQDEVVEVEIPTDKVHYCGNALPIAMSTFCRENFLRSYFRKKFNNSSKRSSKN